MIVMRVVLVALGVAVVLGVGSSAVQAQTAVDPNADPAVMEIGNPVTCPNGLTTTLGGSVNCSHPFNGEAIALSGGSVNLFENGTGSGGADTFKKLLLIVAIPNTASGSAPNLTSINGAAANITPSLIQNGGKNFTAAFGGGKGNPDVYLFAGLTKGNGSESFGNWSTWDKNVVGQNPTSFSIYEYVLPGNALTKGNPSTFGFSGSGIPVGSFVVAWGCTVAQSPCPGADTYTTPFTQGGMVTQGQTPEPGTLALLGTGILGIGGLLRRRSKRNPST